MMVLPPLTFSTTKGWPSFSLKRAASTRATWSVGPPAGNGTMMVTAFAGYSCDHAASGRRSNASRIRISPPWNDGQQQVGHLASREVQSVAPAEDARRAVVRVVVREGPDALHRIRRVRQAGVAAVMRIVLAAHGERKPMARRHDDARRP